MGVFCNENAPAQPFRATQQQVMLAEVRIIVTGVFRRNTGRDDAGT